MVEQTVMEPVMTTEVRKISVTENRQEQRERKYTVSRQVPRTETKSRTVNYSENETRTREEKYTVYNLHGFGSLYRNEKRDTNCNEGRPS